MKDWLQNLFKKKQEEPLEDFVLYTDSAEENSPADSIELEDFDFSQEVPVASETDIVSSPEEELSSPEEDEAFSHTARLDLSAETQKEDTDKNDFAGFLAKHKKALFVGGISVAVLICITVLALVLPPILNPLRDYSKATVTRGNVLSTLNASGTLSANAHYSITSMVSGTVKDSPVEVGDRVEVGTVLYQLDDRDAQLALKRAENQLEKSKSVGNYNTAPLRIYAPESGVIQSMTIRSGNPVSAGQVIGTLKRSDDTVVTITSSVSGTVSSVSVSTGSSVSAGGLLASVQDTQAEMERRASQYDQKSNEYDIEAAKNQIENYTIVSPIGGVVTEKNAKVGDNVAIADTKHPMMVITDTSSMRFTFQVEESKISEVKTGQRVSVTTDSVPNKTFTGKVKTISSEGVRSKSGKLMFDVEILVENPGSLKTGMNVSAKIILATANNTLHIPAKALRNPDGTSAVVLVKTTGKTTSTSSTANKKAKAAKIEIPKGCRLVTVKYGINDGTNVQIISGLKIGETVVYSPDWKTLKLKTASTAPPTETGASAFGSPGVTTVVPGSGTVPSSGTVPGGSSGSPSDAETEAIKQAILEKVMENSMKKEAQQ